MEVDACEILLPWMGRPVQIYFKGKLHILTGNMRCAMYGKVIQNYALHKSPYINCLRWADAANLLQVQSAVYYHAKQYRHTMHIASISIFVIHCNSGKKGKRVFTFQRFKNL